MPVLACHTRTITYHLLLPANTLKSEGSVCPTVLRLPTGSAGLVPSGDKHLGCPWIYRGTRGAGREAAQGQYREGGRPWRLLAPAARVGFAPHPTHQNSETGIRQMPPRPGLFPTLGGGGVTHPAELEGKA